MIGCLLLTFICNVKGDTPGISCFIVGLKYATSTKRTKEQTKINQTQTLTLVFFNSEKLAQDDPPAPFIHQNHS